jgi:hypothetical protein
VQMQRRVEHELLYDGRTVWINGSDGSLLGRFSRNGIDVHGDSHCLEGGCEPGPCDTSHWERFKAKMLQHYGVEVPESAKPKNLSDREDSTIEVLHSELKRSGTSIFRSYCPTCKEGLLLVRRNADMKLSRYDHCVFCGQKVVYMDRDIAGALLYPLEG